MFQSVPLGAGLRRDVPQVMAAQQRREQRQFALLFVAAVFLALAVTVAGLAHGYRLVFDLIAVLVVLTLFVRWPLFSLYTIAACALIVDWVPLSVPIGTDRLPIWAWPSSITSMPDRPIGVVLLFILGVLLVRRLALRQGGLRGGPLLWPFVLFLLAIAIAVVHGLATGGSLKTTSMEIRPFEYLFLSYLLAYNLITKKSHIRLFFWLVIAGAGLKAVQGVYIVFTSLGGHITSGQNEIMGHEDSFFFVALLLLIVLFRLHYSYRPQLIAALAILPPLLYSLLANNRRADYVALIVGLIVAWVLVIVVKPEGRPRRIAILLTCGFLGIIYVLAAANSSGWYAAPAHAVLSTVHPSSADTRDAGSNMYRTIENFDLLYTERQSPLLGYGFGKPFLQPVPLANIKGLDPIYLYVPHNTIYWVWMRAGPLGFLGLWYLFGSIIVRGGIIARRLRDPYLQLVAIYVVAVTFMEILVAYGDYQLFFFRNVIYLGLLAGILMKLPMLDENERDETPPATPPAQRARIITQPATPAMRSALDARGGVS